MEITVGEISRGFRLLSAAASSCSPRMRPWGSGRKAAAARRPARSRISPPWPTCQEGDYVVHVDHGIGIYRGLVKLTVGAEVNDFLELEYQNGDRLYLPVDRLNLVQKYLGVEGVPAPRVARWGANPGNGPRGRVKKAVEKIARELVELYAAAPGAAGPPLFAPGPDLTGSLRPPSPMRKPRTSCRPSPTSWPI